MTIQRKYSLPNCTLLVEGLNVPNEGTPTNDVRPLMTMLVHTECRLANFDPPLTGGREFLESLVTATSAYAQEFLSRVPNPEAHKEQPGAVQLTRIDNNRHRLTVLQNPADSPSSDSTQPAHQIELTTVQLFDLVEAVDQFFVDSQTLPDLSLLLAPVSKRRAGSNQTLVKQAVPATVGVTSLALAAIAFFFVPIPEVQRPTEPKPQSSASPSTNLPATTNGSNSNALAITDPTQLDALKGKLYNQLNQAWKTRSEVRQDLSYRVSVAADGSIVGYKPENTAASNGVKQTPLPNLLQKLVNAPAAKRQPIAQFRVVFPPNDVPRVSSF